MKKVLLSIIAVTSVITIIFLIVRFGAYNMRRVNEQSISWKMEWMTRNRR